MENTSTPVNITINGRELKVDEGTSILQAARQHGIYIPTLCHHEALSDYGGCRLCVVEIDGAPKLSASCVTPVRSGMTVVTENERITESRRTIVEFLFAERNHNCMFCPRSGNCELQRLAYELKMDHLTVSFSYKKFPSDITSPYMAMDHNRCILCGRCVRACTEIAGSHVLAFHHRGPKTMIGMDLQEERSHSTCLNCGVCLQVCPTGAIYNRLRSHYFVKGREHVCEKITTFCPLCGLMCPTDLLISNNQLIQVDGHLSRANGQPNQGQLCCKGRFQVFRSPAGRLLHPLVRKEDGDWVVANWQEALFLTVEKMKAIQVQKGEKALFGLASPMLPMEELILFRELMEKGLNAGYLDTFDGQHFRNLKGTFYGGAIPIRETSWKQVGKSDFILIAGGNPETSQPLLQSIFRRRFMETELRTGLISSLDDVPSFVTDFIHVPSNHLAELLRALLAEVDHLCKKEKQAGKTIGSSGSFPLLAGMGISRDAKSAFTSIARSIAEAENPLVIVDTSLTGMADSNSLNGVIDLARRITPSSKSEPNLLILKPEGNSAGAWKTGMVAQKVPDQADCLKGGLLLMGDESSMGEDILARIHAAEFLAVITPYAHKFLMDRAHVLIPKPTWLEADGTYMSLDGLEQLFRKKTIAPPEGVWATREILSAMGEQIDLKVSSKQEGLFKKRSDPLV
ncbi:MAG: molybdopterin-dependent oxidoreductase [Proteobacteria bacterium]|nr:molybdopterin-dependent oxidoreductase [Pseudomonadota bacterium]